MFHAKAILTLVPLIQCHDFRCFRPQDICQRAQDCVNNETVDEVLSYITYIGIVLSCVGLVITIITMIIFK